MTTTYQRLLRLLQKHLSTVNAEVALSRALRECEISRELFSVRDLPRTVSQLKQHTRLFILPHKRDLLERDLEAFVGRSQTADTEDIAIQAEEDISRARMAALALAKDFGAGSVTAQKIATIVSELARNIVSYAGEGRIMLSVVDSVPRKMQIHASDDGPGIQNLNEILSGQYKSRTGLGKGILGVKRLANRFDLQTDQRGTRVDALVWL